MAPPLPASCLGLSRDLVFGLQSRVELEDGYQVMRTICDSLWLAPALRPNPFMQSTSEFLQLSKMPRDTPLWILFGYNISSKGWGPEYSFVNAPDLKRLKKSAKEFLRIVDVVSWQEWPELYKGGNQICPPLRQRSR